MKIVASSRHQHRSDAAVFRQPPQIVQIIDDMADQLQFMKRQLDRSGFVTGLHSSLDDFCDAVAAQGADLVFVDIHLDRADATDVLQFLHRAGSRAAIYLMSGDTEAMEIARRYGEEIGLAIAGQLVKPFTAKQLLERIGGGGKDVTGEAATAFSALDVEESLAQGWLHPVFQPKLDLRSGRIESAELLCRIAHPDLGKVSPHEFISQLSSQQRQALFVANLRFVLQNFDENVRPGLRINVNVDLANIVAQRDNLNALRAEAPALFDNLVFEITEEVLSEIDDDQLKALYQLCVDGAKLSIDDFGTGHSSFARLSRLPFCEVKIDGSIVAGCSKSTARKVMVNSIIAMSHDLGARVVAEGVERTEDLTFLENAQCDEVQGYLVARPMRFRRLHGFVEDFNRNFAK